MKYALSVVEGYAEYTNSFKLFFYKNLIHEIVSGKLGFFLKARIV